MAYDPGVLRATVITGHGLLIFDSAAQTGRGCAPRGSNRLGWYHDASRPQDEKLFLFACMAGMLSGQPLRTVTVMGERAGLRPAPTIALHL
jgi:hypothetical protein